MTFQPALIMPRVSIHAPARGATGQPKGDGNGSHVSIHAPARGATGLSLSYGAWTPCFNPRPCARGDRLIIVLWCLDAMFQSTPLREGRPEKVSHALV